jgi:hypothetical protein
MIRLYESPEMLEAVETPASECFSIRELEVIIREELEPDCKSELCLLNFLGVSCNSFPLEPLPNDGM